MIGLCFEMVVVLLFWVVVCVGVGVVYIFDIECVELSVCSVFEGEMGLIWVGVFVYDFVVVYLSDVCGDFVFDFVVVGGYVWFDLGGWEVFVRCEIVMGCFF